MIVWRYRVVPQAIGGFELAYGPDGAWARLFGRHAGYRGTQLVRGDEPGVYLIIDRWDSAAAFEACLGESGDEYERLDAELAPLTEAEERIASGRVVEPVRPRDGDARTS